jgi:hypothetical protein
LLTTIAVKLPATILEVNVIDKAVAVAEVTVPVMPLLKRTVLLVAVVSKPRPLIVRVVAFIARLLVLAVITGLPVATCTAAPLLTELQVTTAVKLPAVVGLVPKLTVSEVAVAAVTVPTAPLLNTTLLFPAVVSNPKPAMVMVVASTDITAALEVTDGATVATCTDDPLLTPLEVTVAVRLPAVRGLVLKDIVSDVAVADVTVPTALLLNATVFCAALVWKPKPVMVIVAPLADWFVVLLVMTGVIVAT